MPLDPLMRMPVAMCAFAKIPSSFPSRTALLSGAFVQLLCSSSSSRGASPPPPPPPISSASSSSSSSLLPVLFASNSFVCKEEVCSSRLGNCSCSFSGSVVVSSGLDNRSSRRRLMSRSLISMASSTGNPSQTIAAGEQVDDDAEETEFWHQIEVHQKDAARLTSLEEARTLADCSSTAMLSTISHRYSGSPFGSLVLYATDDDGCPILAISSLSPHTEDLEMNSKCSMLIARDAMDIRDPSVAVIGEAETVSDENRAGVLATYLKKYPDAFWVDFGDFRLVRVIPRKVRFFAGAGSRFNPGEFTWEEYKATTVDPIAPFTTPIAISTELSMWVDGCYWTIVLPGTDEIVAVEHASHLLGHMNRDHAEQTKEIVESSVGVKIDYAKILQVDRLGFTVEAARKGTPLKLRIPFPRSAENRKDVKSLIVEMLQGPTSS